MKNYDGMILYGNSVNDMGRIKSRRMRIKMVCNGHNIAYRILKPLNAKANHFAR